jgi:hypothetical protein
MQIFFVLPLNNFCFQHSLLHFFFLLMKLMYLAMSIYLSHVSVNLVSPTYEQIRNNMNIKIRKCHKSLGAFYRTEPSKLVACTNAFHITLPPVLVSLAYVMLLEYPCHSCRCLLLIACIPSVPLTNRFVYLLDINIFILSYNIYRK